MTVSRRVLHSLFISVSTAIGCSVAHAAAPAPQDEATGSLSEIVVTAEKRETNLQTTPVSISVLGGDDLKNRTVHSLEDLMDGSVPSLRIAPFYSRSSALTVGIRGIVPFDANQPSRDAGVGVYLDGVYLGRSQGLGAALYDIDRIEVLKGPQGTLFGRNSTGGAVDIVTRKPSGEFHVRQVGGVSNFGGYRVETHVDLPRVANISVKLDAIVNKRNGTVENPFEDQRDFNEFNRRGFHGEALWEPSEYFSADYSFDISYDQTTPYYNQLLDHNPTLPPLAGAVRVQPDRADVADVGVPEQKSIGRTHGHALHMSWHPMDNLELKSITSYRELSQSQFDNGGAHATKFAPNGKFSRYSLAGLRQKQYSQEFQLIGSTKRIDYVGGVYYYHEHGEDNAWTPNTLQWDALNGATYFRLPSLEAGAQTPFPDRASNAVANSAAVFGQATWTPPVIDDRLHLTAGARYTHDKKHGDLFMVNGAPTPFNFRVSSGQVNPSFNVAYDVTQSVHLYGKWGTAYRAGGANSRSINYRSFGPEKVGTYEVGLKSEFLDRRARLNLAAYSSRYKSMQVDFAAVNLEKSNRGTLETVNIPGVAMIKGIEADATLMPIQGLTLTASYAFTDYDLPAAANPFKGNALEAVYLVYTPKNAFSAAIDYALPFKSFTLLTHLDANMAGGYHAMASEPLLTQGSFVVNGRLSVEDIAIGKAGDFELAFWVRNLFNEEHTFVAGTLSATTLGTTGIYNDPRTYGVETTLKF